MLMLLMNGLNKITVWLTRLSRCGLLGLLLLTGSLAQAQLPTPDIPPLPVRSYILQDFYSGRILAKHNSQQRMEPASITKLMSSYIVYKHIAAGDVKPDERVRISNNAYKQEGSRMFVEINSQVSVADLLMGVVVQSGNDATVALAEHIAGSEAAFALMMNREAAALGLSGSHFVNSTGLPHPEHYMTARDIAVLLRAMIADYPEHYKAYAIRSFTHNDIKQHNRNKLLWRDDSVDGAKTGHTSSAGFCLAASAQRGPMRLIAVVLGAEKEDQRFTATQTLLEHGFRHYETHKLYKAEQTVTSTSVWKGDVNSIALGFMHDVYITIPKGRYQDMQAALLVNSIIEAPLQQGQQVGNVTIRLDQEAIAELPLVSLSDVAIGSMLGRFADHIMLMFKSLFN